MTTRLPTLLRTTLRHPLMTWIGSRWRPAYRVIIVAIATAALTMIHINMPNKAPDFTVFWAAATHAFGPVYDSSFLTPLQHGPPGERPFAYPPTFLLLILPMALMPFKTAYVAWVSLSVTAFVETGMRLTKLSWLALISPTLMFAAFIGQTTLLMGALAIFALTSLDRPRIAGIALGMAACIKPQLILLVPIALLICRQWRVLLWMAGTGTMLSLATTAVFSPAIWLSWIKSLHAFVAINDGLKIHRLGLDWPWSAISAPAVILLVWWTIYSGDRLRMILATLGGGLLLSPHAVFYESVIILPSAIGMLGLTWRSIPALYIVFGGATAPLSLAATLIALIYPRSIASFPPDQRLYSPR